MIKYCEYFCSKEYYNKRHNWKNRNEKYIFLLKLEEIKQVNLFINILTRHIVIKILKYVHSNIKCVLLWKTAEIILVKFIFV